jgi:hypothetical protein
MVSSIAWVAGGELVDALLFELLADLFLADADPDQVRPQPPGPLQVPNAQWVPDQVQYRILQHG